MFIPREEYFASLPRKIVAAGAIILDENGDMLLVKPNYQDHWNIPGGAAEEGESPKQTCEREVLEEIGLSLNCEHLLEVDHQYRKEEGIDSLKFIYFGGVLNNNQIKNIQLQTEELDEYAFKSAAVAAEMVNPRVAILLPSLMDKLKTLPNTSPPFQNT